MDGGGVLEFAWRRARACVCACAGLSDGCALSITAALGGGLRSRHVAVRERWSVRSQHSLTTPDPSSGGRSGTEAVCSMTVGQNGSFRSGQKSNVLTGRKNK